MKLFRKTGRWTTKERQLLKDKYNTMPAEQLSALMGRSLSSITSQVNYLRKRGWTFNRRKDESN